VFLGVEGEVVQVEEQGNLDVVVHKTAMTAEKFETTDSDDA
jgi:hypothetical protein